MNAIYNNWKLNNSIINYIIIHIFYNITYLVVYILREALINNFMNLNYSRTFIDYIVYVQVYFIDL